MDLHGLIAALSEPRAYPFTVGVVEVHQTHISVVFLAGDFAYKIKKPVTLPFLDFSTLAKRRQFCDAEVQLNRRLAAGVYLGVVPITATDAGLCVEGSGEAVEWGVKMRRLPEQATLEQRLLRDEIKADQVQTLAGRIASFHAAAATDARIASFARFEIVSRNIRENLQLVVPFVGRTVCESVFQQLSELTERTLAECQPLIESRAARGVPRDTHGDLHLDHVYLFPDRAPPNDLVIVDCIEFNDRFRFTDPVADIAFLVMDLKFHGRRDLATAFSDAYFAAAQDAEGRRLLPLYTSYRAGVRGKVDGLLLSESEVPPAEKVQALVRARGHWLLALGELESPQRRPCLVLVAGLPGTGKSTLAQGLAEAGEFTVIRSDIVRKDLAGLSVTAPAEADFQSGIYTREWTDRTYVECLSQAESLLFAGERVIIDATFIEEVRRTAFVAAAVRWGVPVVMFVCEAEPRVVKERLRQRKGDASDADWGVHLHAAARWEQPGPMVRRILHAINMDVSPESAAVRALSILQAADLA